MLWTQEKSNIYIRNSASKPYNDESEFRSEISVPKGKNLHNYVSFI